MILGLFGDKTYNHFTVAALAIAFALVGCGGSAQSDVSSRGGGAPNSSGTLSVGAAGVNAGGAVMGTPASIGGSAGTAGSAIGAGQGGYSGDASNATGWVSAGTASADGGSSSIGSETSLAGINGEAISNVRIYVEIWLFKASEHQPWGELEYRGHSVAGATGSWDVWIDSTSPATVTYVSTTPLDTFSGELNSFLKDAVKSNYGPLSRYYLNVVYGGFDVWSGGDGLQLKQFCAQVR